MVQIPKFSVSIEPQGETVMVHIIGDAGITNADELGRRLLPVTAMRPAIVVIDVQQMSFIASLGLSILMEFQRGINRQGGQVRLLKPQPGVRDMLKKCRLDIVLQVIDSLDELPKPVA